MLFEREPSFPGLPEEGFGLFVTPARAWRRQEILRVIHPALAALGEDLVERLSPRAAAPLRAHLPRLDWPRDYEPFCTWLALSRDAHGYQSGPQLNVGVHPDHVAVRLGWDTSSDAFGRFEFLCRHGSLGTELLELARVAELRFRVYPTGRWPDPVRPVFNSGDDLKGSLDELQRHGAWWEVGRRYELPAAMPLVTVPKFGEVCAEVLESLLPVYDHAKGLPESPHG
jgi:hypothetical protein